MKNLYKNKTLLFFRKFDEYINLDKMFTHLQLKTD